LLRQSPLPRLLLLKPHLLLLQRLLQHPLLLPQLQLVQ
jgi:hypothetical protein